MSDHIHRRTVHDIRTVGLFIFLKILMKGLQKYAFGIYFAGVYLKKSTVMAFVDYYKIMGISKDTPQDQINAAYKKRVKQFHPDLHPDDPKAKAKFQALNETVAGQDKVLPTAVASTRICSAVLTAWGDSAHFSTNFSAHVPVWEASVPAGAVTETVAAKVTAIKETIRRQRHVRMCALTSTLPCWGARSSCLRNRGR